MPAQQFKRLEFVAEFDLPSEIGRLNPLNCRALVFCEIVKISNTHHGCIRKGKTSKFLYYLLLRYLCTLLEVFLTTCNFALNLWFSQVFRANLICVFLAISSTYRRLCRVEINQVFIYKPNLLRCQFHIVTSLLIKNPDILHFT
nr:MAG TPA: hypothetical protein [Caudoviricetes sp.]